MEVLPTKVDTSSREYRENFDVNTALASELKNRLRQAREERSERARARHAEQNKIPVRKRIEMIVDTGTPFLEIAPLAAYGMYDGKIHAAGSISGVGIVHGREFLITGNDATIKGGALFPMTVHKILREQEIAMENRLPMIILVDSAGAYLPLQDEVGVAGGRMFYNQAIMSKMGIPMICAVLGHCTAGGAYIPAMSTYVVMVKGTSAIFLGGPPLVRAATGESVTAEDLGGAAVHCGVSGVSDFFAKDETEALRIVRSLAENVSVQDKTRIPCRQPRPPLYDAQELYGVIPKDLRRPFEVREVIARLADGSEFEEFKARWGRSLVTGTAYIHGYKVGIVANNGVLFSESALKGTQFIQICNQQRVPLLFLQNIVGFMVGKEYERRGITKDGHKMVAAVSCSVVPKFTVVIGAASGAGYFAMCGRPYGPRFMWSWPNSRLCIMGGEQASQVLIQIKREQREREGGAPLSEEEEEAIRRPIMETFERESSPYHHTARLRDDGILDPVETRDVLRTAISVSLNAPIPEPGYGVFRM
ncbi:MAG: methylcrotonoyl-CoA carboxylase [Nitrospirae bacterium]|nr:methylcrotonoyl-CoA carboxylase [Nitrospirota bacterium]